MVLTCPPSVSTASTEKKESLSTAVRLSNSLLLEIPMYAALLMGVLAASNAGNGTDSI